MTHIHFGAQRRFRPVLFGAVAPILTMVAASGCAPASAGELGRAADPAAVARQPHCDRFGQESMALADSDGCVRIRGYVAAGEHSVPDESIGGRAPLFRPLDAPGIVASIPASGDAILKPPISPDRIFAPASRGDAAR